MPPAPAEAEAKTTKPGAAGGWKGFYARHARALWALGLALPVLALALGLLVRPDLFYDQFVWKHLWGSAVADAGQTGHAEFHGIAATDDYTLVAEAVYGAILAVAIYGIYRHVIQRFHVRVDAWFVAAITPFILFGPVTRALEDTSAFCRAGTLRAGGGCDASVFSYLFISPFLYAQIAVFVLFFMVLGALMDRSMANRRVRVAAMAGALGGAAGLYGVLTRLYAAEFTAVAGPGVVLASCALGLALYVVLDRRGAPGPQRCLAAGGLAFLLPGLYLILRWLTGHAWGSTFGDRLYVGATPYILGLPLLAVLVVFAFGKLGGRLRPKLAAYALPLNLGLVYGHMLDGFASFIAICSGSPPGCSGASVFGLDLPSYGEKHPVSNLLLQVGNGWAFPLIKLLLVLAIIYVLDVEYRKDLEKEPNLGGLIKMAILVLGLAPGLRDYLRLAMGT
jgi:uncharacterized membrane protein